ncbi:hypothetical protein SPRG_08195 [Saprolegnia parasitica CBS 223.65]|uniref:Uncharacterized protein n=1 Tax=Saprolegnia parasitica (strain CBS 223.65) TaxID=695850 RepID=A0A067CHV1_SAPPC|nr:hypothetical protein SPRG_08195 [Saprolegnia parasitica CBS 223.65]KDO26392.1 hypothetical protein SPRG_08195 [Saprolegnia parasitica CBS 223.65]|eukprot:XP_012202830.1 hypothetical protein SPRG_08195 [Saprolegnia parasitica CBS 223.65]
MLLRPLEAEVHHARRLVASMRCVVVVSEFFHLLGPALTAHALHFDLSAVVRTSPRAPLPVQDGDAHPTAFVRRRRFFRVLYAHKRHNAKRGMAKFERAARTLQRVYRGYHCRQRLSQRPKDVLRGSNIYGGDERLVYRPPDRVDTRLQRLRARREAYHLTWHDLLALQAKHNVVLAAHVALQEQLQLANGNDVATSLIDGFPSTYAPTIVAHRDVDAARVALLYERLVQPLVHAAVTLVSARLRMRPVRSAFLVRRSIHRARERRRATSHAACLLRLTTTMQRRHLEDANSAATKLASWWRMLQAIPVRLRLRRAHALKQLGVVTWMLLRAKRIARAARYAVHQRHVERHVRQRVWRRWLGSVFGSWRRFVHMVQNERLARRRLYDDGLQKGLHRAAATIQRVTRRYLVDARRCYMEHVRSDLHPFVARYETQWQDDGTVPSALVLSTFAADMAARCEPTNDETWASWAIEYRLPWTRLDPLSTWLPDTTRRCFGASAATRVERWPWRGLFLAFLERVSAWYRHESSRPAQRRAIEGRVEAACTMLSYAAYLAASRRLPSRHDARALQVEWATALAARRRLVASPATTDTRTLASYCTFHRAMGETLCDHCWAMLEVERDATACATCGHAFLARPTESSMASADAVEPIDLLVLHAFFHAMAPVGHANRLRPVPSVWKAATAHALPWIETLYGHGLRTLHDVVHRPQQLGLVGLPRGVHAILLHFVEELGRRM